MFPGSEYSISVEAVIEAGRQVRLATTHRNDIKLLHLQLAMEIQAMLGDTERETEIKRVYALVRRAVDPGAASLDMSILMAEL